MKKKTKIDVPEHPEQRRLQIAAYARISTDSDEQLVSLDAQKTYYEKLIRSNPDWDYAGLYYDEGISGTKTDKRDGLLRMLEDCRKGKIDYIVVKSISRLARNTVDTLEIVRELTDLGIFISFEKENINTLDASGEVLLSQTALSAQRTYEIRELASFFDGLDGPVESYDETYVRRLLSRITVFEDRLVFAFKDGKEVTIQG